MPSTMLKNKVLYRQFIHSVAFVNLKMLYVFKTFVSLLSGHALYHCVERCLGCLTACYVNNIFFLFSAVGLLSMFGGYLIATRSVAGCFLSAHRPTLKSKSFTFCYYRILSYSLGSIFISISLYSCSVL
jgi:hypothetical protein